MAESAALYAGGILMAYDLENKLVVGVSSRALFDLTYENRIFEEDGVESSTRTVLM